ncbi:hypothetical protein BIV57_12825 [Mangrovactinospora gilvigrisea]|uniref:DUF3027 domain-containing protein n=1 Tax=Mangrovactinospora gilvigrisea TaxID=1428644 RepID=A0A1J7C681_9ACTN|nr:hypothetical protein BIV57_12825 [Mangrovactinospora gilvigrisea]
MEAVGLARAAAEDLAGAGAVGEHVDARPEDTDRVVTHYFACKEPAYRGWCWAVTVARASRSKAVTVDEVTLLPSTDALLAPEWVPWNERLQPGDMGPGDLLPVDADDPRLEPGYTAADEPIERPRRPVDELSTLSGEVTAEAEDDLDAVGADIHGRGQIADVAVELGLDRPRVPSRFGLDTSADRWDEAFGAATAMAQAAPAKCLSCGFLMRIGGRLGQAFGICSNEATTSDGRMVSLAYGCGGHSEAAVMPAPPKPPPPVMDEWQIEIDQ